MKKLSDLHKFMARSQALENATPQKLVELTEFSNMQVSRIIHDPLFIEEVERLTNKVEEHQIMRKRKALDIVYDNIEKIVEEQCRLAREAESEGVRSRTGDSMMSYIYRKKDAVKDDEGGGKYVAVQTNPRDSIKSDPDVIPAVNVIKFKKEVSK